LSKLEHETYAWTSLQPQLFIAVLLLGSIADLDVTVTICVEAEHTMPSLAQGPFTRSGNDTPEDEQWTALQQKDYHHPYVPYDVQIDFMSMVYRCLEEGKVGVFESPTGTVSSDTYLVKCAKCLKLETHNAGCDSIKQLQELRGCEI
jgi:hypothetical protein